MCASASQAKRDIGCWLSPQTVTHLSYSPSLIPELIKNSAFPGSIQALAMQISLLDALTL